MNSEKSELDVANALPQAMQQDFEKKQKWNASIFSKRLSSTVKIKNSRILSALSQIPVIAHALKFERGFIAVIPEEFKQGLKDGTLKIMQGKDGSTISMIVDSKTQAIVHQIRLTEFTKLVNPCELSQAMNQFCMKMQLDEIQKELAEFHIETKSQLNEIQRHLHDNRIILAESAKLTFERYEKEGSVSTEIVLSKIDDARAALLKEISSQINSLKTMGYKSISPEKNNEIQTKIGFVIEAINELRDLFLIEIFLNKRNEKRRKELATEYANSLLCILTNENIQILNGYSDFDYLGLSENIWETQLLPMTEQLNCKKIGFEKFYSRREKNELL